MDRKVEIMGAVANVVDFIKQQLRNDLSEANTKANLGLSREQLEKIAFYADNSVTVSFGRASDQVENAINKK
mgnify:FL=1